MDHAEDHAEGQRQRHAAACRGSKVTSERVALLVLSVVLSVAAVVIYRLAFQNMQTSRNLQTLRDEVETWRNNCTGSNMVETSCLQHPKVKSGWELHGDKCYHFSSSRSSWEQSRRFCQCQGGDLVKVDSREEQLFLGIRLREKMEYPDDKFWIGLSDLEDEGSWFWVDGSPLNRSLAFWGKEEPDDWKMENPGGEDCVRMGEKASARELRNWFDRYCRVRHRSICEKPVQMGTYACV